MGRLIDIKEASKLLGVNAKTLRRWDNEGELKPQYRTAGGHRRYNTDDINEYLGNKQIQQQTEKNVFIYCRVSTKKQQDAGNLQRQKDRLIQYCNEKQYNIIHIFEETASGLNDNRRELFKMFKRINEVNIIVVEYSDRLARFGYNYLKEFAKSFNVEIETVEGSKKTEPNEEMVQDLVSLVTCFSAKIYGSRGGRKIKNNIEKSIQELEKERYENSDDNNTGSINKHI